MSSLWGDRRHHGPARDGHRLARQCCEAGDAVVGVASSRKGDSRWGAYSWWSYALRHAGLQDRKAPKIVVMLRRLKSMVDGGPWHLLSRSGREGETREGRAREREGVVQRWCLGGVSGVVGSVVVL